MSTKEQAEFFAHLHNQGTSLGENLRDRAKWYLSLTTIYSAAIIFITEKIPPTSWIEFSLLMITMLGMITSFVLSLWAVRVSAHEAICDPEKALRIMQSNDFDETAFYLDRISDYVVATKRNSSVHRRQATALSIAGMLILVGIVGHGAYFTAHIKKEIDMKNSKEPKSGNNSETLKREETPDNTEKKIDKSSYSSDSLTRRSGYSSDIAYTRKT